VQAASARRTAAEAEPVLATIEHTSRAATGDLRRMLGALRTGGDAGGTGPDTEDVELRASALRATGWTVAADDRPTEERALPPLWPVDVALGLSLVAINVTGSVVPDPSATVEYGDPVLPVLFVLASAPGIALAFRRRHPVAAFAVTFAAMIAVIVLGWQEGTLPFSLLVASYALGVWAVAARGAAALAGMYAVVVLLAVIDAPHIRDGSPADTLIFLVPWVIGLAVRWRRLADEQAVADALAAERVHAAAAERALAEQRLAVARDLHDLVTHSVSAVTVHAAAARHQLGPGPARDALERIEQAGRTALADLRRMLELLDDEPRAEFAPVPGLGELGALVELHRASHGPVRLEVDAAVEREPARIRLTAYRLVQEALTNVARHAPGAATTVSVRSTPAGVVVHVEDEGSRHRPRSISSGGHGLAGMRERVAIVGGSLTSQPTPDGGFRVRAELSRGAAA
jgi:signal transduction histidine kinase